MNKANDTTVEISSVKMPVYGQASFCPSDWYYISTYVEVGLGELKLNNMLSFHYAFDLPLDLKIAPPTSHMAGTKLTYGQQEWVAAINHQRTFVLLVKRSYLVITFVYGEAFIPLILSLLLAHMLFFSPASQDSQSGAFIRNTILAVAGVVIAILPLRAVLVPPEVQGLSQVDFILGAQLALIVCLALVGYAFDLRRTG